MLDTIVTYLDSVKSRDPAARSRLEIALLYPGVRALVFYRLGNALWRAGFHFLARLASELGKLISGIEIHPGATIGRRFFIDHGMGVVIGETAVIHDNVTLYHGVTLGGIGTGTSAVGRRHPELEDGVVIGAGAQVLGPITVRRGARVGANAVVLKEVPPGVTVVGIPAQEVEANESARLESFAPYGAPTNDVPDPTAKALCALTAELQTLRRRIDGLEAVGRTAPAEDVRRSIAVNCGPEG
ncbi:MAG: serine O-acetyltransferase [Alphaproteobacteria bacterium]|nr:serine O-acetyltransferase [Alphaproteobacteria bacterium]